MKISTPIMVMAIALPSYSFYLLPKANKTGKVEMRLSFPFLKKKFSSCKDSSLLARIVMYNRTDSIVTFIDNVANFSFEVQTSTSAYVVERKERGDKGLYKILFPGDSVILNCLLTSQTCQPSAYTRRIPKPGEGLRSIRAVLTQEPEIEETDIKTASYPEENNSTPLTAPGPDRQRSAVRREEGKGTPGEVTRSIFKGKLTSNQVTF
jgi:hypothetical protein